MEDNIYHTRGVLVETNARLVECIVRLAREFGREISTPDKTKKILGIKSEKGDL